MDQMFGTSTVMTVETAHKVLQRALQLLFAVVALLIAFMVQSFVSHAQAAGHPPAGPASVRLTDGERLRDHPAPLWEDASMIF